jgi:hypothetical protein
MFFHGPPGYAGLVGIRALRRLTAAHLNLGEIMLLNTKTIIGHKLSTTDGEFGHVRDFYFDSKTWAVRHVVASIGTWLKERKVLLPPQAFYLFDATGRVLPVNLTQHQIEDCPSFNQHRPVSHQCVADFYRHHDWPAHWQGRRLWGVTDPPFGLPAQSLDDASPGEYGPSDDANLHSTQTVTNYLIEALDGAIGRISGFMLDDRTWAVRHVVVEAGHWYAGREIFISPCQVDRISYPESKVYVKHTKDDLKHAGELDVARTAA